jgi:hypothetical protein
VSRIFIRLAVWSLLVASRFAEANDRAALRSLLPIVQWMLLPSAERAKAMRAS